MSPARSYAIPLKSTHGPLVGLGFQTKKKGKVNRNHCPIWRYVRLSHDTTAGISDHDSGLLVVRASQTTAACWRLIGPFAAEPIAYCFGVINLLRHETESRLRRDISFGSSVGGSIRTWRDRRYPKMFIFLSATSDAADAVSGGRSSVDNLRDPLLFFLLLVICKRICSPVQTCYRYRG
jgi:hypothetical protein